jgi:hypothetical protein
VKQRKPIERRTPMPRGTTPLKRTELKRTTPMPRRSVGVDSSGGPTPPTRGPVRQRLESSEIPKAIRAAVLERDGYACTRCGAAIQRSHYSLQHRDPRGAGGSRLRHTMANLVTLCGSGTTRCHGHVESQRTESYALGWLVPNGAVPEEWPVLRWTSDGTRWQQPGDTWVPASPHPRQLELGGAA